MERSDTKVFISYAREDEKTARRLYADLKRVGIDPWLDVHDLLPGTEWRFAVKKAIRESRFFIALLSSCSISKIGFVQNEFKEALDVLDSFPEGEIFIIPIRLDNCTVPVRFAKLNWVDLFVSYDKGLNKIKKVINPTGGMTRISEGEFFYGELNMVQNIDKPYYIDLTPVTNEQFQSFIDAGGYNTDEHWSAHGIAWRNVNEVDCPDYWELRKKLPTHPVIWVNYYEAEAFAAWVGKRLPSEKEWERAARGNEGRIYPWGNKFYRGRCNLYEDKWRVYDNKENRYKSDYDHDQVRGTSPVYKFKDGRSPEGCYDMLGNVWEWTSSNFKEEGDDIELKYVEKFAGLRIKRVNYGVELEKSIRGSSWDYRGVHNCCSRLGIKSSKRHADLGFRCARDG